MKQVFIIHENNPKLLILFAGWAADETPFKKYRPSGMDFMICYDYRSLDFDATPLSQYRQVCVVAWSMGVWAAGIVLPSVSAPNLVSIAFNGSLRPIDDNEGIPVEIFNATLSNLSHASLRKFMIRMCGSYKAYRSFLEVTPNRGIDEIKEELQLIEKQYLQSKRCNHGYPNYAVIGIRDGIFPPRNLMRHYGGMGKGRIVVADCAHYDEPMFRFLLQDLWAEGTDGLASRLDKIRMTTKNSDDEP